MSHRHDGNKDIVACVVWGTWKGSRVCSYRLKAVITVTRVNTFRIFICCLRTANEGIHEAFEGLRWIYQNPKLVKSGANC